MNEIDFRHHQQFWKEMLKTSVKMDPEQVSAHIMNYIEKHNTCCMATGYGDFIRNTPIEYTWLDGSFWVCTEGGDKFIGLEHNCNVSLGICDPYVSDDDSHGLQVTGTVEFYDRYSEEMKKVLAFKNIPYELIETAPVIVVLIRIVPKRYEMYDTDFVKQGYDVRQTMEL